MSPESAIEPPNPRRLVELWGFLRGLSSLPSLALGMDGLPRSSGDPVLVLPGFMTGDATTVALRRFLGALGYRTRGWQLGRNHGNLKKLVPRVIERVEAHAADSGGQPVRLVGWSLGGVIAREAARRIPERVHSIVTLGSPVIGGPKYTAAAAAYRKRGIDLDRVERRVARQNRDPLPMPITAIYSRRDTIVSWRACIDPNPQNRVEHIEVDAVHAELGFSAPVLRIIAHRLAEAPTAPSNSLP